MTRQGGASDATDLSPRGSTDESRHLASDRSRAAQDAAHAPAPFLPNASDPVHIKDVRGRYKKTNVKTLALGDTIRGSYSGTATT
jgi:hypothetical protein